MISGGLVAEMVTRGQQFSNAGAHHSTNGAHRQGRWPNDMWLALHRVSQRINSPAALDIQSLLEGVLQEIQQSVDFFAAAIWLRDRTNGDIYIAASHGLTTDERRLRYRPAIGLPSRVIQTGRPWIVANTLDEPRFTHVNVSGQRILSAVYAPLYAGCNILGAIALYNDHPSAYGRVELSFVSALSSQIALAVANLNYQEELKQLTALEEELHRETTVRKELSTMLGRLEEQMRQACRLLEAGEVAKARTLLTEFAASHNADLPQQRPEGLRIQLWQQPSGDGAPAAQGHKPEALLTRRETEVFRLVAGGATNVEIAKTLGITEPTVKTHVRNLLMKLDVERRIQLAVYANICPNLTLTRNHSGDEESC